MKNQVEKLLPSMRSTGFPIHLPNPVPTNRSPAFHLFDMVELPWITEKVWQWLVEDTDIGLYYTCILWHRRNGLKGDLTTWEFPPGGFGSLFINLVPLKMFVEPKPFRSIYIMRRDIVHRKIGCHPNPANSMAMLGWRLSWKIIWVYPIPATSPVLKHIPCNVCDR